VIIAVRNTTHFIAGVPSHLNAIALISVRSWHALENASLIYALYVESQPLAQASVIRGIALGIATKRGRKRPTNLIRFVAFVSLIKLVESEVAKQD